MPLDLLVLSADLVVSAGLAEEASAALANAGQAHPKAASPAKNSTRYAFMVVDGKNPRFRRRGRLFIKGV